MKNMIKFGSIEYYNIIELRDKINKSDYNNFDLKNLDKLRFEIDSIIENIKNMTENKYNETRSESIEPSKTESDLPEINEYIKRFNKTYSPRTTPKDVALYEGNFTILKDAITLISFVKNQNKFKTEIYFREGRMKIKYVIYLTATDIVNVDSSIKVINEFTHPKAASIGYKVIDFDIEGGLEPLSQREPLEHLGERKTDTDKCVPTNEWSKFSSWSYWDKPNYKLIKSFVAVGDVIEVEYCGELQIFTVDKFEVIMNSLYGPTEFVIHVKFSYNNGKSSIECTSDSFKYVRHIK